MDIVAPIGASAVANTPAESIENGISVWNFSDLPDTVDLNSFPALFGKQIRMFAGNDRVTGANSGSSGWANQVNGNLGIDILIGGSLRDNYQGGKDSDSLGGLAGQDWLNGNSGEDYVYGGEGNDILRGGKDSDLLKGDAGDDILVGDFGHDHLTGGFGNDRFVLRTDSVTEGGVVYNNVLPNHDEMDIIFDFSTSAGNRDKIVIPGVSSFSQLVLTNDTHDGLSGTLISFKEAEGGEHIGFVANITALSLGSNGGANNFVLGSTADDFFSKITPEFFLANPNMATDLIPV